MGGFKDPDFVERQNAAAKARQAVLDKFRATAADPVLAERQTARMADASERAAARKARAAEKAEKQATAAEAAKQAERDAAAQAERARAEDADRERALRAEQKAARDARYAARKVRSKRRSRGLAADPRQQPKPDLAMVPNRGGSLYPIRFAAWRKIFSPSGSNCMAAKNSSRP